ncbi:MAG: PIN domain-containing protein [Pyrinomonadaceae bacterium]
MSEEAQPGTPLLVVYDCMVFLQGLVRKSGPAVACLELFERGEIELLISNEVLLEIQDVLTRSKLQRKFPV